MIKVIEIENIKGIGKKRFELGIYPNKPSLLVAPNGFGKSSIATAFKSMNNRRISLADDDLHENNPDNKPKIYIEIKKSDGSIVELNASNESNTISKVIDCFVINNQVKPKGDASIKYGHGNRKASLIIDDIVLVDKIPENIQFNYSFSAYKKRFGSNGKIIPNLEVVFNNLGLIKYIGEKHLELSRADGQRIKARISSFIEYVNAQNGSTQELLQSIESNQLVNVKLIEYLNTIGDIISTFDIGLNSEVKSYLAAIQLIWLFNDNSENFIKAIARSNYKMERKQVDETLSNFNCTWQDIRSSETQGKLLVRFPKAINISNGERDILTFISMLFKAKKCLKKTENILIIDEVFDFLDDANLTAAQYYISTFIKEFDENRRIYPLIFTHLNPNYFKNFVFSNQKVYYLDKSAVSVDNHMVRLLRYRDDESIKEAVSKHLFHFSPEVINKRLEFRTLMLPELWGEGEAFYMYLENQVDNYIKNLPYCPLAVCGAVRIAIEKIAFNQLKGEDAQFEFLQTRTTRLKLEKADGRGIISPEAHYLLGVIYNEGMHWNNREDDNISPIASKLEHKTIKKLISDVFL